MSEWLSKSIAAAEAFTNLDKDYNVYGIDPPNAVALDSMFTVLKRMDELEFHQGIAGEGGLAIWFRESDRYADIECFNGGDVLAVVSDMISPSYAWEIPKDLSLDETILRIKEFMNVESRLS